MSFYEEVERLTLELIKTPSMNNTTGEKIIAAKIAAYLRSLDYFKKHPDCVWEVPLKNDRYGRENVMALIKGEKAKSPTTVILHGHIDTVGIEDFGNLMEYAFDPIALEQKLKEVDLPDEVKQDLDSGEWMFGRGSNDMKSGVAAHLAVIKHLSERADQLEGNVIFMANPVEENQHTGIIESLPFLKTLKQKYGLEYRLAINTDYISPLYIGDTKKYIYLGAVGKLLPCFYIVGKETHVGQCFEGLDPNMIASELVRMININSELCDEFDGEYTLPPAALKLSDLKPSYNVQTPLATFLYFNYFTHDVSIDRVIAILKDKAEKAFTNVINYVDEQYKNYCSKTGLTYTKVPWKTNVITYEELYNEVKNKIGSQLDEKIDVIVKELQAKGTDARIICLKIVEEVKKLSMDSSPVVVIFFSPPFCPHNTIKGKTDGEKKLLQVIENVAKEISDDTGETFEIRKFFPCLSDSSYLTMDDDDDSLNALINNFPEWYKIYPVPVKQIRETNIPAINFGTYGKDAHRWTERVHKKYTFSVLPKMILLAIEKVLG
jgi:arginine utilization protein RocB